MNKTFRNRFFDSYSDNRKSKTCVSDVEVSKIENWWGLLLSLSYSRCVGLWLRPAAEEGPADRLSTRAMQL